MTRPGKPPTPNNTTGHPNQLPRSFGMVLEAIRLDLGLTQKEMLERLRQAESQYKLPKVKGKGRNPGATISEWENARTNIPFSAQHRYGTVAGTYSGILHLVSLFYANFRNSCDLAFEDSQRKQYLEENAMVAEGLIALANFVKQISVDDRVDRLFDPQEQLQPNVQTSHHRFISELLAVYAVKARQRR